VSRPRESPRKRSRAAALQVLFSLEFSAHPAASAVDEETPEGLDAPPSAAPAPEEVAPDPGADLARAQLAFDEVGAHFELPEGARAFAKELVFGVVRARGELDALIAEHARNWRVERMASVDRNVLRVGVYELLHGDAPAAVVIDEAVELARRFSGDRSPAFVNGVLDAVSSVVRPPEEAAR